MRILAGIVLLVAAVVLLLSLAVGGGVWYVRGPITDKATQTFGRIDAALTLADQSLEQVKVSLGRAAERLEAVNEEQRKLAQQPQPKLSVNRMVARTVQNRLAPEVGNAQEKLHAVAEAAVVVNSVLEDVGNLPFLSATGIDVSALTAMNSQLAGVGPAAWELSRLLGDPTPDGSAADQVSRIEQTLTALKGLIADYEGQLAGVRQRTTELKARFLSGILPATVLISFAGFWIALSQVSLMAHARGWWKKSG